MPLISIRITAPVPVGGSSSPPVPPVQSATITSPGGAGPAGPQGPAGVGAAFLGAYNNATTYASGTAVLGSDQNWYVSLAGGNVGHNPVGDGGVHWSNINGPSVAVVGNGPASRDKVLVLPAGIGLDQIPYADDSPYNVVADAKNAAFTSVSGTLLSYAGAVASDVGKTVCIPGAGRDDGFGVKDAWTTTIASVVVGVSATLTNAAPTAVSTGSNKQVVIGTDNTSALATFVSGIGAQGYRGYLPRGNILHTGTIDFASALGSTAGLGFFGHGTGATNTTAPAGTGFWFVGPVASAANGAGIPAFQAASTIGLYGLKMGRFGLRCLRALDVSTTVVGAGQVISSTPITLNVAATAGMAAKGRVRIAPGVIEAQYTGIGSATTLTGVQTVSGSYTTVGGEVARTVNAAIFWDFMTSADLEDINVVAYQDNNAVNTSRNQGRAGWFNNFSVGECHMRRIHARYFQGGEETWRFGTCNAGYGPRGNGGGCQVDVISAMSTYAGIWVYAPDSGPVDGNVFSTVKAIVTGGPRPDGSNTYGVKVDPNCQGNKFMGIHAEGPYNGVACSGHNNTFDTIFTNSEGAPAGGADGSAAIAFTGTATGNEVTGGGAGLWTGGSPGAPTGTPGFSYMVTAAAGTTGNRVRIRPLTSFTVPGIAMFNDLGSGNVFIDTSAGVESFVPLRERSGWLGSATPTSGSPYILGINPAVSSVLLGQATTGIGAFYFDLSLYPPQASLQLVARVITDNVAPAANFTFAMWAVGSFGGTSALPTIATIGSSVSGSTTTITAPGAAAGTVSKSAGSNLPATGWYFMGVIVSSTTAVNSFEVCQAELHLVLPF